jgi:ATP-dependent Lon protease
VGDRDSRANKFTAQLRAFDPGKSGAATGVGALLAFCSALLREEPQGRSDRGRWAQPGGSIEPIYNAEGIVEAAVDKGAKTILLPVTTRAELVGVDDDIATRVMVIFYGDALLTALKE